MDTQVLIVGAGPVGLTLAIDLGRRGIRCILVEKNDAPLGYPKMERCNPRTMEIFRRLGIADRVRAAGYPPEWPMDVFFVFDLARPPLLAMPYPSVADARLKRDATLDGSLPLEPYQIISQYTLEPLLRSVAEALPTVEVRFGHECVGFTQDATGVTAQVRRSDGERLDLRATYLVGCDGGSSPVRKQLGIGMAGEPHIREMRQALFHCPDLFDRVPAPRGRHYHRVDDCWTLMIVQDSRRHFTLHAIVERDEDMATLFEKIVGTPVRYEMLHCAKWTQRLLLADRYRDGRVFIAGDAAHLVIPTGGLGMNTGVGDAIDLAWKLAATLAGWGGPRLLDAYEVERRQVGARNVQASGGGARGRATWRALWRPEVEDDTPEGRAALARLLEVAKDEAPKANRVVGAELGYRYEDSPVIANVPGGPPHVVEEYVPTTWPGARLPHVWIEPGRVSVHDRIPDDRFTLVRLAGANQAVEPLEQAFRDSHVPFGLLDVPASPARGTYGVDFLLVRPDLHVAWRGDSLPADPAGLVRRLSGW